MSHELIVEAENKQLRAELEKLRQENAILQAGQTTRHNLMSYGRWADEGVICSTCDRRAKVYRYSLTSDMTYILGLIYRNSLKGRTTHVVNEIKDLGQKLYRHYTDLSYWGLAVPLEHKSFDGPTSGYWQITERGKDFLLRRSRERKWLFGYNAGVVEPPVEQQAPLIDILEASENRWSFDAMFDTKAVCPVMGTVPRKRKAVKEPPETV